MMSNAGETMPSEHTTILEEESMPSEVVTMPSDEEATLTADEICRNALPELTKCRNETIAEFVGLSFEDIRQKLIAMDFRDFCR
jgi:hypothetical protein